jgi:excisionase family DNA binding protein
MARQRPGQAAEPVKLLTIEETAQAENCSMMHVYRQIARGELTAVDIALPGAKRSKTRIRSDDLAEYIERQTRGR